MKEISRRDFVKTVAIGGASLSLGSAVFHKPSKALASGGPRKAPGAWSPNPYEIHPMLTVKVESFPLAMFTYLHNFGQFITVGSGFFYIKGVPGYHIMVDTGSRDTTFKLFGFKATTVATTEERLAELGLKPSDIDMVILTHLHFDHVENLKLLNNAKVVVQKSELKEKPVPAQAGFYIQDMWKGADFKVVDGDVELFPGLWVLHTPGHSMGSQSVLVDTRSGRRIILGLCACDENIEKKITPGILTNAGIAHKNMLRVIDMADTVITMHDMKTFEQVYR